MAQEIFLKTKTNLSLAGIKFNLAPIQSDYKVDALPTAPSLKYNFEEYLLWEIRNQF